MRVAHNDAQILRSGVVRWRTTLFPQDDNWVGYSTLTLGKQQVFRLRVWVASDPYASLKMTVCLLFRPPFHEEREMVGQPMESRDAFWKIMKPKWFVDIHPLSTERGMVRIICFSSIGTTREIPRPAGKNAGTSG